MVGPTWILRAGIWLLGSDLKAIKATMIDAQWKAPLSENVRHNAHTSHLCHYHNCCNPMHYCIEMAGLNYERVAGIFMEDCPHGNKDPTRMCRPQNYNDFGDRKSRTKLEHSIARNYHSITECPYPNCNESSVMTYEELRTHLHDSHMGHLFTPLYKQETVHAREDCDFSVNLLITSNPERTSCSTYQALEHPEQPYQFQHFYGICPRPIQTEKVFKRVEPSWWRYSARWRVQDRVQSVVRVFV